MRHPHTWEDRRLIWDFLRDLNSRGKTIILTTHYLEEAESMCKNVAIIDRGVIVENNSMRKVLSKLAYEHYVLDLGSPLQKVPEILGAEVTLTDADGTRLEVSLPMGHDLCYIFHELKQVGAMVLSIRNKTNRLEELFLQLTKYKKQG